MASQASSQASSRSYHRAVQTGTLVSVQEYLTTDYSPDCDYVEGMVLERNVGERDHSSLQKALIVYLGVRERDLGIRVYPEQRVQVQTTRFRVPDICVILGSPPDEQIFTRPPFLCIEILSKDDRMTQIEERIHDYLNFGVRYVWVVDPSTRRGYIWTAGFMREVQDGFLRTEDPEITVPLAEIFAEL